MELGGLTHVSLAAALFILVARAIRIRPAGVPALEPAPPAAAPVPAAATPDRGLDAVRIQPVLRYCGVCEERMDGTCARCDGPACITCDHCFGCRLHVCDACDFEPTPPFWLPGDKAPHPHNTLHD
jgi:hypothetical protein